MWPTTARTPHTGGWHGLARLAVQHALRLEGIATHLQGNDDCDILRQTLNNFLTPLSPREEQLRKTVKER